MHGDSEQPAAVDEGWANRASRSPLIFGRRRRLQTVDHNGHGAPALVVVFDGVEVAVCPVGDLGHPELSVVDVLARMQLEAKRLGGHVYVRDPTCELRGLLELVGLSDVLLGRPRLPLEAGWEPEGGEQLRIEKVVEPGDAPP